MKKIIMSILFIFIISACVTIGVSAAPVDSTPQVCTQPLYGNFTATPYGDEYIDYWVSEDDYVIVRGEYDYWYYATIASCEVEGVPADKIVSAGFRYGLQPVPLFHSNIIYMAVKSQSGLTALIA